MELLKLRGENATAGFNSQIKGSSAPFSFCFDKKIADYSQFICLCPLLIPGAVKRWLRSRRWWDHITPEHWMFIWNWRRRQPLHCTVYQKKKSEKLSLHENPWAKHCSLKHLLCRHNKCKYLTCKNIQHTSKLSVEFRLNEPEARNGGNSRCINAPVSPEQTSENLGRSQREGGLPQSKKKKQMQRAKQGLTAARLITTWQPAALARKKAAFPQCNTGQSRQEAAGKTTKFMGVCLARKRRHLCWCSRHNNSVDPKHIRERKRKNNTEGWNIKHVQQALAIALGREHASRLMSLWGKHVIKET